MSPDERLRAIERDLLTANAAMASLEGKLKTILRNLELLSSECASVPPDNVYVLNPPKDYPLPT
jgi:hypothetical protein